MVFILNGKHHFKAVLDCKEIYGKLDSGCEDTAMAWPNAQFSQKFVTNRGDALVKVYPIDFQ